MCSLIDILQWKKKIRKIPMIFDIETFLILPLFRGKGRNPWKNLVGFLEDLKTPKDFEINWPLELV